jgi:hypothetical protein
MKVTPSARNATRTEQSDIVPSRNDLAIWSCTAAMIFLIEFCVRGRHGAFGSRGPEIYWAFHWASDYSAGFVRRGLLGATIRAIHLDNTSFQLITFCSLATSIALYTIFMIAVYRLVRARSRVEKTLVALVLALSPLTTGMILETTGDPLQLLMLGFLILFFVLVLRGRSVAVAAFSFAVLGAIGAFVHEASLFFILPSLLIAAFVLQKTPVAKAAFWGNLIGGLLFTVAIVLHTQKETAAALHLPIIHDHQIVETMPSNEFPKFSELLAIENHANFGYGARGDIATGIRLCGILFLPVMLICFVTAFFYGRFQSSPETRRKIYTAFGLSFLLSVPLYIIGHDWGRFSSYSFLLTLSILIFWKTEETLQPFSERQPPLYLGLVIAGLTLVPSPVRYTLIGVLYSRVVFLSEVVLIGLLMSQSWMYWRSNLSTARTPLPLISENGDALEDATYESHGQA